MGLLKKRYDYRFSGKVVDVTGTDLIPIGIYMSATLDSNVITIANSSLTFTLEKNQIVHCGVHFTPTESMKNKNVIARGAIGGALLGKTGAVVGALSGIGSKKSISILHYAFIDFESSNKERVQITFEVDDIEFRNADKFSKQVNPVTTEPIKL